MPIKTVYINAGFGLSSSAPLKEADEAKRNKVIYAHDMSIRILTLVLDLLSKDGIPEGDQALFKLLFKTDTTLAGSSKVVGGICAKILEGIKNSEIVVTIVSLFPSATIGTKNGAKLSLSTATLTSARSATHYFIHECAHLFPELIDHAERGYIKIDRTQYQADGLTFDEALKNADTYATFFMDLSCSKALDLGYPVTEEKKA